MNISNVWMMLLVIILVILTASEGIIIWTMKVKIDTANHIRSGYERKCNSFKIKYTMLGKLENKDCVIAKVKKIQKPVYLYGGGIIGNKFRHILETDPQIKILRVLESEEVKDADNFAEKLQENTVIIITPMFDYDAIVSLLTEKGISKERIVGLDECV